MDIADLIEGDRIINHVTGLLNPVLLGAHILNVTLTFTETQLKRLLRQEEPAVDGEPRIDDRFKNAVNAYYVASSAIDRLLHEPHELADLGRKYGKENLPVVKKYAEKYLEAARSLLQAMKDMPPANNISRDWVVKTLDALNAPPRNRQQGLPAVKLPRPSLVAVEGVRVDHPADM